MLSQIFQQLAALPPSALAAVSALAGAFGAIIGALVSRLVVSPFLGARDRQDKEIEWRNHAIELAKLDLERRLKTYIPGTSPPLRPSILDFLANYRDLQDLSSMSPKDLYVVIKDKRVTRQAHPPLNDQADAQAASNKNKP